MITKKDKGDPSRFPVCSNLSVSTPVIRLDILGLLRRVIVYLHLTRGSPLSSVVYSRR